jgi:hypothetical protein
LLLYKDAVPTRLSLSCVVKVLCVGSSHDSPQPRVTTLGPQQRLTPPHWRVQSHHMSRESDIPQGLNSESGPPWECWTPRYTVRTSKVGPGPPRVQVRPLEWDPDPPRMGFGPPTMGSQGLKTEHTRALNRTQAGVRCRHVSRDGSGSGCVRV